MPISSRNLPEEPPSSATVTMAVRSSVDVAQRTEARVQPVPAAQRHDD